MSCQNNKSEASGDLIARTVRRCLNTYLGSNDYLSVFNGVNSALEGLRHGGYLSFYVCEKMMIHENPVSSIVMRRGSMTPGDLSVDSDGKINGLVVWSDGKEFLVLRTEKIYSTSIEVDLRIGMKNCDESILIHVEEPLL